MSEWAYMVHKQEKLQQAVRETRETWHGIAIMAAVCGFALGLVVGVVATMIPTPGAIP